MDKKFKIALETAQELAKHPEIVVAAAAHQYPDIQQEAIRRLAVYIEIAMERYVEELCLPK